MLDIQFDPQNCNFIEDNADLTHTLKCMYVHNCTHIYIYADRCTYIYIYIDKHKTPTVFPGNEALSVDSRAYAGAMGASGA